MVVEISSFSYNRIAFGALGKKRSSVKLSAQFKKNKVVAKTPATVIYNYSSKNKQVLSIQSGDELMLYGYDPQKKTDWIKACKTEKNDKGVERIVKGYVPTSFIQIDLVHDEGSKSDRDSSDTSLQVKIPKAPAVDESKIPVEPKETQYHIVDTMYYGSISGGNYRFFFPDIDIDTINLGKEGTHLNIKLQLGDPENKKVSDEKLSVTLADEIQEMFSTIKKKKETADDPNKFYECVWFWDDLPLDWSTKGKKKDPPKPRNVHLTGLSQTSSIAVPVTPPTVKQMTMQHLLKEDGTMDYGYIDISVYVIESHRDGIDLFHTRIPPSIRMTTASSFAAPSNPIYVSILNEFPAVVNNRLVAAPPSSDSVENRLKKGEKCEFRIQDMLGTVYDSFQGSFPGRMLEVVPMDAPLIKKPVIKNSSTIKAAPTPKKEDGKEGKEVKEKKVGIRPGEGANDDKSKESGEESDSESESGSDGEALCCSPRSGSCCEPESKRTKLPFFTSPISNIKIAAMVIWNMREVIHREMVTQPQRVDVAGKLVKIQNLLDVKLSDYVVDDQIFDFDKSINIHSPLQILRFLSAGIYTEAFKLLLSEWWLDPIYICTIALRVVQENIENEEPGPWEKVKSECIDVIGVVMSSVPIVKRKRMFESCNCCECCGDDESPYYHVVGHMITRSYETMMKYEMKSIVASPPISAGTSNILWNTRSIPFAQYVWITPTAFHALQLTFYLLFLAILTYNVSGLMQTSELSLKNKVTGDLFSGDPNGFDKIGDFDTFWNWLDNRFLGGLEGLASQSQYLLYDSVVLRQLHFPPTECPAPATKGNITQCYTQDISEWNSNSVDSTWQGSPLQDLTRKSLSDPYGSPLPSVAYTEVLQFSSGFTGMRNRVRALKSQSWIDYGTRFVTIEYLLYSPNSDTFLGGAGVVSFDNTGQVTANENKKTYSNYFIGGDFSILDIVLICFFTGFLLQETFDFVYIALKNSNSNDSVFEYFGDPWNVLDLVISITGIIATVLSHVPDSAIQNIDLVTFWDVSLQIQWSKILGSVCVVAAWVRLLNYFIPLPGLGTLVLTIQEMINAIFRWVLIFISILIGFSAAFTVLYGANDPTVVNWQTAVLTTVQRTFGGFQLPSYTNVLVDPTIVIGLILQVLYLLITVILLLNLLIALINTSYTDIQEAAETEYRWQLAQYIEELSGLWPVPLNIVQIFVYFPFRLCQEICCPDCKFRCCKNASLGWIGRKQHMLLNWRPKIDMVTEMHSHFWKGLDQKENAPPVIEPSTSNNEGFGADQSVSSPRSVYNGSATYRNTKTPRSFK
eukprot:TRINITY_DN1966_c0_g3_i2.p1 TRINITY_DN1966_c0_g3~~TRINITY_DN1966_c0_g3_i2.p1  ORF type:complete len:1307 (-),score=237.14 TRINITY_DN1966_c0_g3_i2:61-3981(-)